MPLPAENSRTAAAMAFALFSGVAPAALAALAILSPCYTRRAAVLAFSVGPSRHPEYPARF